MFLEHQIPRPHFLRLVMTSLTALLDVSSNWWAPIALSPGQCGARLVMCGSDGLENGPSPNAHSLITNGMRRYGGESRNRWWEIMRINDDTVWRTDGTTKGRERGNETNHRDRRGIKWKYKKRKVWHSEPSDHCVLPSRGYGVNETSLTIRCDICGSWLSCESTFHGFQNREYKYYSML